MLDVLVREHQAELYRYLCYLGASAHAAEDLVQETFLAAYRIEKYPDASDPRGCSAWLRAIARNMFLRYCRRKKRNLEFASGSYLEQADAVWQSEFLREGDGFDYVEALRECLDRLSDRQRRVLELRYAQRKSRVEMARMLAMTENGVKSLLRRLRSALGDCVEHRLAEERAT